MDTLVNTQKIFHQIIKENDFSKLQQFVENHPQFSFNDNVSFDMACSFCDIEIVNFLFQLGADIKGDFNAPLKSACLRGSLPIVQFFIEHGADIHINENLCLVYACEKSHFDVVEYLINNGANIYEGENYALYISAVRGHLELCLYLYSFYEDKSIAKQIILDDFFFINTADRISENYLDSFIESYKLHKQLDNELKFNIREVKKIKL